MRLACIILPDTGENCLHFLADHGKNSNWNPEKLCATRNQEILFSLWFNYSSRLAE